MRKSGLRRNGRGWIRCVIQTALFAAVLTGCGKTEISQDAGVETEEQREQAEDGMEEMAEDADTLQVLPEESAQAACPIYEVSTGETVRWAIWSEGIYCYSNGDRCGYLSEEGDRITSCLYEEAMPFSEGLACVRLDGKYGYIGKDGETMLPFIYDQASSFREGVAYFSIGEKYGLIDPEGNVVLELTDCDSISSYREGLAYFSVDGRYGYMNKNGDTIVDPIYDDAGYFHDGIAIVIKNGLGGVIGKDGTVILPPEYIAVRILGSCILAQKGDRLFFYDTGGNEISSAPGNQFSEMDGIYYISIDNKTGFADEDGRIILEPVYESIRPIPARELVMVQNEEGGYGILDYEGNITVPFCRYDSVSYFEGDRAVVGVNEKYGVLRYDGTLEMPIEYDKIELFSDGSVAVWEGDTVELADGGGNLILTGEYWSLDESKNGYTARGSGGKEKFFDKTGNLISEYEYEVLSSAHGVKNTYIVSNGPDSDRLLRKGAEDEELLEEVLLTNQITPKVSAFKDFLKNGNIRNPFAASETVHMEQMRQWKRCSKLYRMGEEESTVLYFFAEPLHPFVFGESNSGLYTVREGSAKALIEVGESGGSMGGDKTCLWYDTKEGVLKPGTTWRMGGFGGAANGAVVYELKQGNKILENVFGFCIQSVTNYSKETLLENAELFYDDDGNTFTRENILEAGSVMEYTVNEKQVSAEDFYAVNNRYICYWPMDLN